MKLPRPLYIIARFGEALFSSVSRLANASLLGGSTHQTISSRAHIEAYGSERWANAEKWINRLFFWQEDHCRWAWNYEVDNAIKTLERNGAIIAEMPLEAVA